LKETKEVLFLMNSTYACSATFSSGKAHEKESPLNLSWGSFFGCPVRSTRSPTTIHERFPPAVTNLNTSNSNQESSARQEQDELHSKHKLQHGANN
jgi:hypothetical protein